MVCVWGGDGRTELWHLGTHQHRRKLLLSHRLKNILEGRGDVTRQLPLLRAVRQNKTNRLCCCVPTCPALGKQREENHELKTRLGHLVSP